MCRDRRPRVLHVAAVDFTVDRLLAPQMAAARAAGFDVSVACAREDERAWAALAPFSPVDVAVPRRLAPVQLIRALTRLVVLIRATSPDILHVHTPAVAIPLRLLPAFVFPRRTKIYYTVHGYLHQWDLENPRERWIERLERWGSRRTHTTLFQSVDDFDQARRRNYAGNTVYLGNGVQDVWFGLPPARRGDGRLKLLFVGRIVREKGVLDLVEALRGLAHDVELSLVGDQLPSDRDGVARTVQETVEGDPVLRVRVTMHGLVPAPDVRAHMAESHVLVLPSHREGVPRSVIEALAASRPVIATRIRGSQELVEPSRNGWLVPARDVVALRRAISEAAAMDVEAYSTMAAAARASVHPHRRESAVVERLLDAYRAGTEISV